MTTPLLSTGLRCAYQVNPLGVPPDRVRLSWTLQGTGRDRMQRAYQVQVTDSDTPALMWDSGRVESSSPADIAYAGTLLARGGRYTWRVRVWDESLTCSDWSDPA